MISIASKPASSGQNTRLSYPGSFALMTLLFFMWGFMTVWNDILIPHFKEIFALSYFQAMLVQFSFFGAYAVGSAVYYGISMTMGDPINRIGYKNGVVLGLLISAGGSALFYPAAAETSYPLFLLALFVVGLGFALLQITANPFVTILGPEETASSRLNLSQAFNSLGATIGPLIGGQLIFMYFARSGVHGADAVKLPYLGCAAIFVIAAMLFRFARLPAFASSENPARGLGALKRPHTVLGIVSIFMYVGGEVAVGSSLINYLGASHIGGMSPDAASKFLSYFWGGLMIGRFMGAFALSQLRPGLKKIFVLSIPALACGVIGLVGGLEQIVAYSPFLFLLVVAFLIGSASPQRMLALFAAIIVGLLLTGLWGSGHVAMWAVLSVGLFCSIMWSNIFSLAIEGLGNLKSQASSLLIMAILGGAVIPPLQGVVADAWGIQTSLIVPIIAFTYLIYYGVHGYRVGRRQPMSTSVAAGRAVPSSANSL